MNKHIIFLLLLLSFVSCNDTLEVEHFTTDVQRLLSNENSYVRSYDEALKIAEQSISMLEDSSITRSISSRTISLNDTKVCLRVSNSATRSDEQDTLIYVFNFADNRGFALVSASKNTEGLLAITEKGFFDPEKKPQNGGFNEFVENAKRYVEKSMADSFTRGAASFDPQYRDSIVYSTIARGPYLTVKWGQELPEGEFCSNGYAGCSNVAIAQILSYYAYPSSVSLTYPGRDKSTQTLNWELIKAHDTGHSLSNCLISDTATHKAIGRFIRQIGELSYSNYDSLMTATNSIYQQSALSSLGYSSSTTSIYPSVVKSQLDYQKLILINGRDNIENYGHSWVIDGYRYVTSTCYRFIAVPGGWDLYSITTNTTNLYHFNWGWYGECDGFFNSVAFYDVQGADIYDIGGEENHFHTFFPRLSLIIEGHD